MSAKGIGKPTEINSDTIEDEEMATHQEAIPIPYLAGSQMLAVRWITPALDRVARQAPQDRPGKK